MPITNLFKLDKIILPAGVEFSHLINARVSPEIASMMEHPAGHPFPMFGATTNVRPAASWSTGQIDVGIAALGQAGAQLTTDSYVYVKTATKTGIPNRASATHRRFRIPVGIVYFSQVSLPHNGRGTIDLMLLAAWDGSNDPLIAQGGVALSGSLGAGNYFGAGPVYINGSQVNGIQQIDISNNVQPLIGGGDSELYDSFVGIETAVPTITITSNQPIDIEALGLAGLTLNGSTGIVCFGRKYAANAARVANATAEHIAFQGLLGRALPIENTGDGTAAKRHQLRCELIASTDAVVPMLCLPGQAIP